MPHFDARKIYSCEKQCEKISSAICFNLDQSKILLSGNGLNCLRNSSILQKFKILYIVQWSGANRIHLKIN